MRVVGYVRVSTGEQADHGAGLGAQRQAIQAACHERGWQLVDIVEDAGFSAKDLNRPGITHALNMVESSHADGLVVAKLDRLSRSLLDFAGLMERSRKKQWALVALDLGVDTSSPQGEMLASVLASFAQFERRLIGQRTKDALAIKRAEGTRLGRPPTLSPAVVVRIRRMRSRGLTMARIADLLNRDEVPTAHGGQRWYPSTVHAILRAAS